MKRDMALIKKILINIENDLSKDNIEGYSEQEILYHRGLLINSGFVNGRAYIGAVTINGLTWEGHNLLDTLKDDNKFKIIKDLGKNLPQEALKTALNYAISSSLT